MNWSKRVTVSYYNIEAEVDYFSKFYDNMETMISANNRHGIFEANELTYQWELLERIDTPEAPTYFFSVVKERPAWPVWIRNDGRAELTLSEGSLGDIAYGIFNPAYEFLLCFAAGSGGSSTHFRNLLGQFSTEGKVRFNPIYEERVDEKVMQWDSFKSMSISMNMPSGDDVSDFESTKAGELMKLLGFVGGLKVDISVSSGGGREALSTMMVKDLIPELLVNDLCTGLKIRGSDYEDLKPEQFDLKNAQIKYFESIEVEGNYITDADAKQVLMRALNERASILFRSY